MNAKLVGWCCYSTVKHTDMKNNVGTGVEKEVSEKRVIFVG